jgi:hypothetical protein
VGRIALAAANRQVKLARPGWSIGMTETPNYPDGVGWPTQPPTHFGPALPRTSGYAIASLACGVVGLLTCCGFVPSLLGIVFGGVSLGPIRRGEASGRGLAIGGIILGIAGAIVGIAFWLLAALAPGNTPIPGREVSEGNRRTLVSLGALEEGEQIELFYPSGFFSIEEGGVLITAERLVLYYQGSEVQVCRLADIRAIDFTPGVGWIGEGQFLVERDDGELMLFSVDSMDGGDKLFHGVLRRQVDQARQAAGKPPAASEVQPTDDDLESEAGED